MNLRSALVALVAALTIASTVAAPVAAAGASDAATDRLGAPGVLASPPPGSQVLNATAEVKIWERAIFPLRANPDDAAFTVDNAAWDASLKGFATKSLNKDEIAVYQVNDQVRLTFEDGRAGAQRELKNQGVQLVAARLDGDQSNTVDAFSTIEGLRDLLTQSNANDNATFEVVDTGPLDEDGDRTFTYTPSDPGQYVLFIAKTENGSLSAPGGDIQLSGDNVTVVGVEGIAVRGGAPSVSPGKSRYAPGDDVTFSADTSGAVQVGAGENVSHAVLLYDEQTYQNGVFKLVADDHLDQNFDVSQDVTLEHSIEKVNGVQRSVGNPTAFGITASSGTSSGANSLETVLNFLVQNTSLSNSLKPQTTATGNTVLHASMTAVNGTPTDSFVVETRSDWRNACYRWIYVATDDSGTEFAATTGSVGIGRNCGANPPPSGGVDDDVDPGEGETTVSSTGSAKTRVSSVGRQVTVDIEGAQAGETVTVQRTDKKVTDEVERHGSALESIETSFNQASDFDMEITQSNNKPEPSAPDPPSQTRTVGYINVAHSASDDSVGEVRFNFRVSQQRLDDAGLSTDEVVLYRYSGGEWTALETEYLGTAEDGTPRFRAISPGLSVFAIGGQQTQQETPTEGPTTTEEPPATDGPTTTAAPATPTTAPIEEPGGFSGLTIIAIVVLALVAIGGLYWYRQQ